MIGAALHARLVSGGRSSDLGITIRGAWVVKHYAKKIEECFDSHLQGGCCDSRMLLIVEWS
jgi:hypothetical protein